MVGIIQDVSALQIALPVVVAAVVIVRLYYGSVVFAPRFVSVWAVGRRILTPILQRVVYRFLPVQIALESTVTKAEYVGVVDHSPQELALRIDGERDVEIPLLATVSEDWDGNIEDGTFVWYCGPKPAWLPRWLRPYQVHITCFEIGGQTRVTAHYEANSYRPDYWMSHFVSNGHRSVGKGVQRAKRAIQDANVRLRKTSVRVS